MKNRIRMIKDKRGVSLVEVMIALVVLLLVFMGLMQTALMSIDHNMRNILRDEAIGIGSMEMEQARSEPFTSMVSDTNSLSAGGCAVADCPTGFSATGVCVLRDVRNISGFKFCTNVSCTELGGDGDCSTDDSDNKRLNITVGWKWKGEDYRHSIATLRRR